MMPLLQASRTSLPQQCIATKYANDPTRWSLARIHDDGIAFSQKLFGLPKNNNNSTSGLDLMYVVSSIIIINLPTVYYDVDV